MIFVSSSETKIVNIFEFKDYKAYFNSWVETLPKGGRGEYRKLSQRLNVSTTMVSQVFRGDKHLSLELASDLCDYLNLSEQETDYFFLLVEYARAGSFGLQQKLLRRISIAQEAAQKLEARLKKDKELTEDTKAVFYSSWMHSAVRNLVAVPALSNVQAISERLHLPLPQVQKVLDFLLKEGLVVRDESRLVVGPRRTHLGAESPLAARHHQNWRTFGFQKMILSEPNNLFYTGPMSLSAEVAQMVRKELPAFIEKINKWVIPSPSEVTKCLNIDWFEF